MSQVRILLGEPEFSGRGICLGLFVDSGVSLGALTTVRRFAQTCDVLFQTCDAISWTCDVLFQSEKSGFLAKYASQPRLLKQKSTSQLSESTSQPAGFPLRLARIYITAHSIHITTRKKIHHSPRIYRTGFLRFPLWSKELLVTKRTQFLLSTSVYHSQTTVWRTYGYVNTQV